MVVGIAWNAGAVRARLLGRRRLGTEGCRELARRETLDRALDDLGRSPYAHDVRPGMVLAEAQWAVAATPLWHLRILAGWLPPVGGAAVRSLASWWEALDVENLLVGLAGGTTLQPHELGRLDTAWGRLRGAASPTEVAEVMRSSPWGDPGGDEPARIVARLRLAWAERVATEVEGAGRLAAGWAVLQADRTEQAAPLSRRMSMAGEWVLGDESGTEDQWHAEVRWWRTVDEQGRRWLRQPGVGSDAALGAFCVLLADAHRVQGALALAARGGADEEAIHALL